jgi:ADP-ribosylarginine hydrolase
MNRKNNEYISNMTHSNVIIQQGSDDQGSDDQGSDDQGSDDQGSDDQGSGPHIESDSVDVNVNINRSVVEATMILHALGDTIGFKNGDWEFNYKDVSKIITLDYVNELIYEFIGLGGVNSIDLSDWAVSDDTIFHLNVGLSMLHYRGVVDDKMILRLKADLFNALKMSMAEDGIVRYIGMNTGYTVDRFTKDHDARSEEYNRKAGGNGCAMRTLVMGLCLHKEADLDQLIDLSIISSQLTHNNALGYLGGFAAAYFTSLAVRRVDIQEWPYLLLEQLKSDKMVGFIKKTVSRETRDYMDYIMYWEKHIDNRFKDRKLIDIKSFSNPMYRIRYYYDQFFVGTDSFQIGDSGLAAMVMAYDAVLDSGGVWEKLIVYAMLHSGDSDTIGAIAGGLFGAYYGFSDVPQKMYSNIEFGDKIYDVVKKIEKKYF